MPAVKAPAKVLVTGANGFIAVAAVKALVEHGFTVVGAVRKPEKGAYLEKLVGADKFSTVIVEDIEKDDAYDEAVKGVDAVFHMASPVTLKSKSVDAVVKPAVAGTTNIIKSIIKNGSNVKRLVLTGSAAAINSPKDGEYTFTEDDWNEYSLKVVEEEGDNAPGPQIYRASKVLGERAAWKLIEDAKPAFDLVVINPPMVYGPLFQEVASKKSMNESSELFWLLLTLPKQPPPAPMSMVDVRDVAEGQVLALETEEAGGNRFITSSGRHDWVEFRDYVHKAGLPGVGPGTDAGMTHSKNPTVEDGSKAARVLGLKYHSHADTVVDTYKAILALPDA